MAKINSLNLQQFNQIAKKQERLTDAELRLTHYIQMHFNELIYCGITDVSGNACVSKATIGRYLNKLGFTGYSAFKRSIELGLRSQQLRSPIAIHHEKVPPAFLSTENLTLQFSKNIQQLLDEFIQNLCLPDLDNFIQLLTNKQKRIFVVGPSSSFAMAKHFSTLIKYFRNDIHSLSLDTSELPKEMLNINKDDVLIIFSYYRFNNVVIDIGRWFKKCGAKIALVTNTLSNPYGKFTDIQFIMPSEANAIFQSRIIGFYFIELVLHLCYEKLENEGNFQALEELFQYFHTFSSLEKNIL
ncbi:MurR/RpiR family transcriptional regulator [Rodentibacter trehalosifermentans]|uniref:Transcriptional regulator n=1 Tax=Rodentibacter trehalosifermentans TaxID=1908263 RepID=A0A1V3IVV9_9PAST|nr:MurR/RpiR family transcriptional regulator [Rodentibacter trehalosifermentans]OOF46217.1 transcriptional regulator [Rodentibacter trehalosifermentans]OOF53933.1 transcriptional regulator [Rodentibacter trehalosifermentans]